MGGREWASERIKEDEIGALCCAFRAACECAIRWGWSEEKLVRLLRVCFRWERDGAIPKSIDGATASGPKTLEVGA